ncbi:hypothetical protein N7931_07205 [Catenovulum sp. 2E275]|uniref:hypothetical protein n=1 Tax=Catenovulum sp. 2E275 TaxID=2980497 RepID=UPI0021D285F6|nr:hypothetical protein [Catenovulum sp. 2E275]MCU4675419.1 hypothetical protein [Catenovulum sp. 2E275]
MYYQCFQINFSEYMSSLVLKINAGTIWVLFCLTSLTSCASTSELTPSNYQTQLTYPEQTDTLFFVEQTDSDNPLYGTRLTYQSTFYELDIFNVFIYPVRHLQWQPALPVLMDEARMNYQGLDEFIQQNNYKSRTLEDIDQLDWQIAGKSVQGLRGVSRVHLHDELYMHNYAYFFIKEDKVVRITTNMKFAEQLPPPDDYILGLLAQLTVPKESAYMSQLRQSVE